MKLGGQHASDLLCHCIALRTSEMLMHANNFERLNMGKEVMEARTQYQEIAFAPGAPPMASLDMEPLIIMGD